MFRNYKFYFSENIRGKYTLILKNESILNLKNINYFKNVTLKN